MSRMALLKEGFGQYLDRVIEGQRTDTSVFDKTPPNPELKHIPSPHTHRPRSFQLGSTNSRKRTEVPSIPPHRHPPQTRKKEKGRKPCPPHTLPPAYPPPHSRQPHQKRPTLSKTTSRLQFSTCGRIDVTSKVSSPLCCRLTLLWRVPECIIETTGFPGHFLFEDIVSGLWDVGGARGSVITRP